MTPSHLHFNNLNVEDFRALMPEHEKWAGPMAILLEQYARRRRCRNMLDQAGLTVSHERVLMVEKECEVITQVNYDKWAREDADEDTRVIFYDLDDKGEPE